jgi:uncharacterized membrane protein
MSAILTDLKKTIIAGLVLTVIMVYSLGSITGDVFTVDELYTKFIIRWVHVLAGVMWIGLLYYFNFVQIPNMPNIPDEQKPAIGKVIAPAALFWFRWGAMVTIISGLILAHLNEYLVEALTLGASEGFSNGKNIAIGIGMWMGIIMFINVWFVIWPNQKKALGIVDASAEQKASSARTAMLFSRTNTLLSVPMLYAMVSAQNMY